MEKVAVTILFIVAVIAFVWLVLAPTLYEQSQCEQNGGIFYSGTLSANNCVFPPKQV